MISGSIDEQAIREKAYELWLMRGCQDGRSIEDWLEAERLLGQKGVKYGLKELPQAAGRGARQKR